MNKHILTVAIALTGVLAASAGKPATPPDSTRGFNALDYVLQRPLRNTEFDDSVETVEDRWYFSGAVGADWVHEAETHYHTPGTGINAELRGGYRFNPVHALQLTLGVGRHYTGEEGHRPSYASLAVDWAMNLSAMNNHRNHNNKFEFWASAGIEGQLLRHLGQWEGAYGARIALQARYYPTPRTYLFIEPRWGIYSDHIDGQSNWLGYDWGANIMVGVGYRMKHGSWRHDSGEEFHSESFTDNMFYGVGGGAIVNLENTSLSWLAKHTGPDASIFVGKMFTAQSGARVDLTFGHHYNEFSRKSNFWMLDFDYVWDISRTVAGYDPYSKFNTILAVGPSLAFSQGHTPYIGADISLQERWNITPNWGVYIEPRLRFFSNKFCNNSDCMLPYDMMGSLHVGVQYTLNSKFHSDFSRFYNPEEDREEWLKAKNGFINLAGGLIRRNGAWPHNEAFNLSFGRWFSPVTAWRAGFEFENSSLPYHSWIAAVGGDIMVDMSALTMGYDPDRLFRFSPLVGAQVGGAHYQTTNYFTFGGKIGAQLAFRVHPKIDLFVEPQYVAWHLPNYSEHYLIPEWRIMAGISYRLGNQPSDRNIETDGQNFVSVKGGAAWSTESLSMSRWTQVAPTASIQIGRWLDNINGVRLGIAFDELATLEYKPSENKVYTIKANYMLNLNELVSHEDNDDFRVSAFAGVGFGIAPKGIKKLGWSVDGGIQFSYRLTEKFDVFVEPELTLWNQNMVQDYTIGHRFIGSASIGAGVTYHF